MGSWTMSINKYMLVNDKQKKKTCTVIILGEANLMQSHSFQYHTVKKELNKITYKPVRSC